jgi:hypothetical protein
MLIKEELKCFLEERIPKINMCRAVLSSVNKCVGLRECETVEQLLENVDEYVQLLDEYYENKTSLSATLGNLIRVAKYDEVRQLWGGDTAVPDKARVALSEARKAVCKLKGKGDDRSEMAPTEDGCSEWLVAGLKRVQELLGLPGGDDPRETLSAIEAEAVRLAADRPRAALIEQQHSDMWHTILRTKKGDPGHGQD